jgi:hypothetical protein
VLQEDTAYSTFYHHLLKPWVHYVSAGGGERFRLHHATTLHYPAALGAYRGM